MIVPARVLLNLLITTSSVMTGLPIVVVYSNFHQILLCCFYCALLLFTSRKQLIVNQTLPVGVIHHPPSSCIVFYEN